MTEEQSEGIVRELGDLAARDVVIAWHHPDRAVCGLTYARGRGGEARSTRTFCGSSAPKALGRSGWNGLAAVAASDQMARTWYCQCDAPLSRVLPSALESGRCRLPDRAGTRGNPTPLQECCPASLGRAQTLR